jgi:hypothetical protein
VAQRTRWAGKVAPMKIKIDCEAAGAIEVSACQPTPPGQVVVTISDGAQKASTTLTGAQARQVAGALIAACGGGGDAG